MALIIDLDDLLDSALDDGSTNFHIDPVARTIKLVPGQGALIASDGVTGKAVWSFLKTQWHADPLAKNLASIPFPMENLTDEFYELIEGWNWEDATTRNSLRNVGWIVRNVSGDLIEHWAGVKAIGNILGTDQLYYNLSGTPVDFTFAGAPNQAVQIISDPNGDGNYADGFNNSAAFEIFNREEAQIFNSANLSSIGESSLLAPKVFSFAVGTGVDDNIIDTDANVAANLPYTGMSITYHAAPQSRTIGASDFDFGVIVDGNGGNKQQIYTFLNYQLRNISDIDADADVKIGQLQSLIAQFNGSNIETLPVANPDGGGTGVFVDNFDGVEINDWTFTDNVGAKPTFPTLTPFTINFNDIAQGDSTFKYWVYFADPSAAANDEWGSIGGVLLQDNGNADITGLLGGAASVTATIAYDTLNLAGHTPGTDINVVVVGIGIEANGGKYVRTTATITAQASSASLVANLDRQFQNVA